MGAYQTWIYESRRRCLVKSQRSRGGWLGVLDLVKVLLHACEFDEYRMFSCFNTIEPQICLGYVSMTDLIYSDEVESSSPYRIT